MTRPKTDIWYPWFVGDYRKDTARLSCEQHGAYRLLIDEYWVAGPLPDDDEVLARLAVLDLRTWRKHRPVIERFFKVRGGVWRHKRIEAELAAAGKRKESASEKARFAAEERWRRERALREADDASGNAPSMLQAMPEQCPGDASSPSPSHSSAYPSQELGSDSPSTSSVAEIVPLAGRTGR